jgi:hypothetical protein
LLKQQLDKYEIETNIAAELTVAIPFNSSNKLISKLILIF